MNLLRWRCTAEACDASAAGVGDRCGLRAIGWNLEHGRLLCPKHRTDRPKPAVYDEIHKLQGLLGLTTLVSRSLEYFGAPAVREPQPGEPALWPTIGPTDAATRSEDLE